MVKIKAVIGLSIACIILSFAALLYNFFNMYSLPAKCLEDLSKQPCQAYDNWQFVNRAAIALLVPGISVLVVALIKQRAKS